MPQHSLQHVQTGQRRSPGVLLTGRIVPGFDPELTLGPDGDGALGDLRDLVTGAWRGHCWWDDF